MLLYNHKSDKITKPIRLVLNKIIDRDSITKEGYAKPAVGPFNQQIGLIKNEEVQRQDIKASPEDIYLIDCKVNKKNDFVA